MNNNCYYFTKWIEKIENIVNNTFIFSDDELYELFQKKTQS